MTAEVPTTLRSLFETLTPYLAAALLLLASMMTNHRSRPSVVTPWRSGNVAVSSAFTWTLDRKVRPLLADAVDGTKPNSATAATPAASTRCLFIDHSLIDSVACAVCRSMGSVTSSSRLFDRERVGRAGDATRDVERCRHEQTGVAAVGRAICCQRRQVEELAEGNAEHRQQQRMGEQLVHPLRMVRSQLGDFFRVPTGARRPHLYRGIVGADRGDVEIPQELRGALA